MKVMLGVPWYIPDSLGGTELYVAGLSQHLQKSGVECVVAVPSNRSVVESHDGVRVIRYPKAHFTSDSSPSILDSTLPEEFERILLAERPDIYHQHEWSANCGIFHIERAKFLGIGTIVTFHLPKIVCRTNTMMLFNREQCDGQVIEDRCAACTLITRGAPAGVAKLAASVPSSLANRLTGLPKIGRLFAVRADARKIAAGLLRIGETVDRIVTVSQWQKQALERNGVPSSKILHIVSGFNPERSWEEARNQDRADSANNNVRKLRIGFLGRAHRVKGLHHLVEALTKCSCLDRMSLRALVLVQDSVTKTKYIDDIKRTAREHRLDFDIKVNQPRESVASFSGKSMFLRLRLNGPKTAL